MVCVHAAIEQFQLVPTGQDVLSRTPIEVHQDGWTQLFFIQCPKEDETLVCLLYKALGVCGPGQVLRDVGSQELEAGDTFNNHPVNVDGVMRAFFLLPEVHNKLLCLTGVKEQVTVSAPCGLVLHLLPVCSLIVVSDEANHCGVICKLDDELDPCTGLQSWV